ncbi:hypothetical protein OCV47_08600 [Muricoprocola aceti]|uniref:Uncharacterized protein n=1 Tax=Muricoprocola aceti TaxID=2981772 RepID=A0ABT2SM58_9FIRM|nr:hypothetical protein [Muricoprocola aceti]MCU6725406.1 hypothetical protein [Muricoprocola aceti]
MIQRFTTIKSTIINRSHTLWQYQRSQRLTSEKGILTNRMQLILSMEFHRLQLRIFRKQILRKFRYRSRQRDPPHRRAVSKSAGADSSHLIRQTEIRQTIAVTKGSRSNMRKFSRKLYRLNHTFTLKSLRCNPSDIRWNQRIRMNIPTGIFSGNNPII